MLRLSELIGSEVFDGNNRSVGHVRDVRFVRDGPAVGEFGPALRVQSVIVGPARVPFRLGVGRAEIRGPWLAHVLARWLGRNARVYDWEQVVKVEGGRVDVRGEGGELRDPDQG